VKRGKDEEVNGQGGEEGCPGPTRGTRESSPICVDEKHYRPLHYRYLSTVVNQTSSNS